MLHPKEVHDLPLDEMDVVAEFLLRLGIIKLLCCPLRRFKISHLDEMGVGDESVLCDVEHYSKSSHFSFDNYEITSY